MFNNYLIYLTTFLLVFLTGVYIYLNNLLKYWKKLGVPYFEPKFLYGNGEDVIKAKITSAEWCAEGYKVMKSKGFKHLGLYVFHKPIYVPIDPELIKKILTTDFQYFHDRGIYYNEENDPLSAHLFALNGTKWKNLRAKLTPTFTSGKMKKMFPILVDCAQEMSNYLEEIAGKRDPVHIKTILSLHTTDVIGCCAFGIECNGFKNPNTDFIRLGKQLSNPKPIERAKQFLAFLFPGLAEYLKLRITNKEVEDFYMKLVKDTIKYRETNNITRNDFMQLLIQLKNNQFIHDEPESNNPKSTTLTLNEICAQAFLFFFAGLETSSTAMTFCLFELTQNLNIQEKVREEIVSVLKKHNGQITYDSLKEMPYLERVIQESLRKYPSLLILQRKVTIDYKIPETDITLEKGTIVVIPTYALHHDPEYYPDPECFDPDRFLEEQKATRPDFTYLPFGDGPKVCIGLRFGMMQVKVGLCQLLRHFKFTLNKDTKLPLVLDPNSFSASSLHPIMLNIQHVTD